MSVSTSPTATVCPRCLSTNRPSALQSLYFSTHIGRDSVSCICADEPEGMHLGLAFMTSVPAVFVSAMSLLQCAITSTPLKCS
jgi:hypothetical protein